MNTTTKTLAMGAAGMTGEQFRQPRRLGRRQADVDVHLAIFVFAIAGMTLLNWILSPSFWWVTFPAAVWGMSLAADAASVFLEGRHRLGRA
jgi:uncharacterized membrane protein YoaK (UPF0700 family)